MITQLAAILLLVLATGVLAGYLWGYHNGAINTVEYALYHAGIIEDDGINEEMSEYIKEIMQSVRKKQSKPARSNRPLTRNEAKHILLGNNKEYQAALKAQESDNEKP